jgi:hypothetical protein
VIDRVPDIILVGNQKYGDSRVIEVNGEKCLVVLIEGFSEGGLVVVECREMTVEVIKFRNEIE